MRRHLHRFMYFAAIGGSVFLLNIAVVQLFVTVLGFNPIIVYPFALAAGTTVDYLLNRHFTWGDRLLQFKRSASRYGLLHVATAVAEYALFTAFVHVGLVVLVAQVVAGSVSGTLNYLGTHTWAFATDKAKEAVSIGRS